MPRDSLRATKWVYDTLLANSALTTLLGGSYIYPDVIPRGAALPAVVVSHVAERAQLRSIPVKASGWVWTPELVQVKVVSSDAYRPAVDDAVIAALDAQTSKSISGGGTVWSCLLQPGNPQYTEVVGDLIFCHSPMLFEVKTKA